MALDDYEPVAARLARWLEQEFNGQPRVITHMVSEPGTDVCVFRAELWIDNILIATGWAEEVRGQGNVNRTSHVENCETSAIGRALANTGIAGSDMTKRPSREEMAKVQRYESGPRPPASFEARGMTGNITEKQIGFIKGAYKRSGAIPPNSLSSWTKAAASEWIDQYKNDVPVADIELTPSDQEEPF